MKMILETDRLYLREINESDIPALRKILQDKEVMAAYEHAFSDEEVLDWLNRQLTRYTEDGSGLWAVILKETGTMIGQCGITLQKWDQRQVPEIGYLFQKDHWHKGYATEAAAACKKYAFERLGLSEIYSIIRDTNTASQNVAIRNGMTVCGRFIKHYHGIDMPHLVFSAKNIGILSETGEPVPEIGTREYEAYCLKKLGIAYCSADFSEFYPFLSDDCVWESQWVLEPRIGKETIVEYYENKSRSLRESDSRISFTVVQLIGNLNTGTVQDLVVNGEKRHGSFGLFYENNKPCLYLRQRANGELNGMIIQPEFDNNGKLKRLDVCIPELFRFEPYKKESL
jgi:RimJ/RimL family protein N-acetyltransferase